MLNGEQPWWSPAQSSCLFVLVFRIQPSCCFVESVQKEWERLETYFFAFITNFTLILSTLINLLRYLLQLQISDETNQHLRDTLCNYTRWNRKFHFLGLTLPKIGFRFWSSENQCRNKNPNPRDTMCANFKAK